MFEEFVKRVESLIRFNFADRLIHDGIFKSLDDFWAAEERNTGRPLAEHVRDMWDLGARDPGKVAAEYLRYIGDLAKKGIRAGDPYIKERWEKALRFAAPVEADRFDSFVDKFKEFYDKHGLGNDAEDWAEHVWDYEGIRDPAEGINFVAEQLGYEGPLEKPGVYVPPSSTGMTFRRFHDTAVKLFEDNYLSSLVDKGSFASKEQASQYLANLHLHVENFLKTLWDEGIHSPERAFDEYMSELINLRSYNIPLKGNANFKDKVWERLFPTDETKLPPPPEDLLHGSYTPWDTEDKINDTLDRIVHDYYFKLGQDYSQAASIDQRLNDIERAAWIEQERAIDEGARRFDAEVAFLERRMPQEDIDFMNAIDDRLVHETTAPEYEFWRSGLPPRDAIDAVIDTYVWNPKDFGFDRVEGWEALNYWQNNLESKRKVAGMYTGLNRRYPEIKGDDIMDFLRTDISNMRASASHNRPPSMNWEFLKGNLKSYPDYANYVERRGLQMLQETAALRETALAGDGVEAMLGRELAAAKVASRVARNARIARTVGKVVGAVGAAGDLAFASQLNEAGIHPTYSLGPGNVPYAGYSPGSATQAVGDIMNTLLSPPSGGVSRNVDPKVRLGGGTPGVEFR